MLDTDNFYTHRNFNLNAMSSVSLKASNILPNMVPNIPKSTVHFGTSKYMENVNSKLRVYIISILKEPSACFLVRTLCIVMDDSHWSCVWINNGSVKAFCRTKPLKGLHVWQLLWPVGQRVVMEKAKYIPPIHSKSLAIPPQNKNKNILQGTLITFKGFDLDKVFPDKLGLLKILSVFKKDQSAQRSETVGSKVKFFISGGSGSSRPDSDPLPLCPPSPCSSGLRFWTLRKTGPQRKGCLKLSRHWSS